MLKLSWVLLLPVFPCSSIIPVDVTDDAELGGFLEVNNLGEILVTGCKDGLVHTRLNLVSLDEYAKVAYSKNFCAFRCFPKR